MRDEMAHRIAEKQYRAHRNLCSSQDLEDMDRTHTEETRKQELLGLLKKDPEFKKRFKKIINS